MSSYSSPSCQTHYYKRSHTASFSIPFRFLYPILITPFSLCLPPPLYTKNIISMELVLQYLKRKVFSCPLPASIIPELHVCKSDPWDLPGSFLFSIHTHHPLSLSLISIPCPHFLVIWTKRDTSLAQKWPNIPMEIAPTEPQIRVIGRQLAWTNKLLLQKATTKLSE